VTILSTSSQPQSARTPVPLSRVKFSGKFWGRFQDLVRTATIPATYQRLKETGRIDAFRLEWEEGMPNPPHIFWDSDVAKWVETAAYALVTHSDPDLRSIVDETVSLICSAQQPDGYLNTHFTVVEPEKRWTNMRDNHELYCAGHLIEAAVAHYLATDESNFVAAMRRYADYIDTVFGLEDGQKRGYCGHEEIELALVKLYRLTAERRYLDLAKYFIDQRGQMPDYFEVEARLRGEAPRSLGVDILSGDECRPPAPGSPMIHQNHLPVREQDEIVGHAVRAMYLCSGMADVVAETGDEELFEACKRLWEDATERKMYVTGGLGSHRADEGFTCAYDLPNETAYCETCAAVALVFFAHRMLRLDLDGKYADVMERALYNGALGGLALDGVHFFYENPLAVAKGAKPRQRQDWFGCACCPNNISRIIMDLGEYAYSEGANEAIINLYAEGEALLTVGGQAITLRQETEYPWSGEVKITMSAGHGANFILRLRWPGWCDGGSVVVNGEDMPFEVQKGYVSIERTWQDEDVIELSFPMPARRVYANPRVKADVGRVALACGPIIYCLEEADNGPDLDAIYLPRDQPLHLALEDALLGGVGVITGKAFQIDPALANGPLYRSEEVTLQRMPFVAVPYFAWANRKPGEMLVWIREI